MVDSKTRADRAYLPTNNYHPSGCAGRATSTKILIADEMDTLDFLHINTYYAHITVVVTD